jgi:hypothetical protein
MAVLRCGPAETVHYDHEGAGRAMRRRGLAEGYADALLSGSWLSGDVLLEAEREQRRDPGSVLGMRPGCALPSDAAVYSSSRGRTRPMCVAPGARALCALSRSRSG